MGTPGAAPHNPLAGLASLRQIEGREARPRARLPGERADRRRPGERACRGRLAGIIESHDVVFLNREAARIATGWQGSDLELVERVERVVRSAPERIVVLTLADAGAVLFAEGRQIAVAAPSVEPVDATGAGDAFAGVFLATWLTGAEPEYAAKAAVMAASRSVTVPGAQEMRLSGAELQTLLGPARAPVAAA